MFLRSVLDDELKDQSEDDRHVLNGFGLQACINICSTVVKQLKEPRALSSPSKLLPTREHVFWCMEAVGHSFMLPVEEYDVISGALDIYNVWFFEPKKRPPCISRNETSYYKNMFCHMSLLFDEKAHSYYQNSSAALEKHIKLCHSALILYWKIGRRLGTRLTAKSWNILLKILLGISEVLMQGPVERTSLGSKLEPICLCVLLDVWMRWCSSAHWSHDAPNMWGWLAKLARGWMHRRWFVELWNLVCRALTRRMQRILYASEAEQEENNKDKQSPPPKPELDNSVSIKWNVTSTSTDSMNLLINLTDKKAIYTWHQMVHIVLGDDPTKMNEPDTFLKAAQGVAELSDFFVSVSNAILRPVVSNVEGNFILNEFGPWLFDAARHAVQGFEQGRAASLGALCRIFVQQHGQLFPSDDLANFFHVLIGVLTSSKTMSPAVDAIITHCSSLFTCSLKGNRVLVPHFMPHLRYILTDKDSGAGLRSAAIAILSSLVTIGNHYFGSLEVVQAVEDKTDVKSFKQANLMKHHLLTLPTLLEHSLVSESDVTNLQNLIWTICVYTHQLNSRYQLTPGKGTDAFSVSSSASAFAPLAISKVWKLLSSSDHPKKAKWPMKVTLTALRMLGTMASFSSSIVQHDLTAIVTFLHNLCPYVEYHLSRLIHKQNKYVSRAVAIPSSPGSAASKSAAAAKSGADSAKGAAVLTAQAKRSSGTAARKAKAGSSLLGQQHTGRLGGKAEAVPGFTREALRDMRRSSALVTAGLWCVYEWVSHCPWLIALDTAPILSATDKSHARAASLDFAALERTDSYTAANMAAAANTSAAGAKRASMAKDAPLMHHVLRLAVMGLSSQTNAYSAWDVHNASLVLLRLMVSDLGRYTYIDRGLNLAGGPPPCSPQTAELSALLEWCSARKLPLGTGLGRKLAQLRGNVRLSSSLTEWDIVYWMSLQGHLTLPAGTNIGRLTAMSHHGGRAGGTGWDSALAYALHKNVRFFLLNSRALVSVIECDAHQGPPADDSKEDERKSIPLAPGARDEAGVRDSVTAHGHVLQPPYTIVVLRNLSGRFVWQVDGLISAKLDDARSADSADDANGVAEPASTTPAKTGKETELASTGTKWRSPSEPRERPPGNGPIDHAKEDMFAHALSTAATKAQAAGDDNDTIVPLSSSLSTSITSWQATQLWTEEQRNQNRYQIYHGIMTGAMEHQNKQTAELKSQLEAAGAGDAGSKAKAPVVASKGFHNSRLLLSSLGILSPFSPTKLAQSFPPSLAPSASRKEQQTDLQWLDATERLMAEVRRLDDLPEREALTASLFFRKAGQISEWEMAANAIDMQGTLDPTSMEGQFQQLVKSVATNVELRHHRGFRGNCLESEFSHIPYASSQRSELVFHVPAIARPEVPVERRLELCAEDGVRVIFCEDNSLFSPSFESLSSGPKSAQRGGRRKDRPLVYIVITPQSEGLFHINVRSGPMSKKASSAPLAKPTAPVTTPAATGMSITPSAAVAAVHDAAAKAAAKAAAAKAANVMPRARSSSESKVAADADKEKAPALRTQSGLAASAVSALYSRMGARQHDAAPATNFSSLLMAGPLIDGMLISSDGLAFLIQRSCKNLARAVVQLMYGSFNPFSARRRALQRISGDTSTTPSLLYETLFAPAKDHAEPLEEEEEED